jgi:hypothetical protein
VSPPPWDPPEPFPAQINRCTPQAALRVLRKFSTEGGSKWSDAAHASSRMSGTWHSPGLIGTLLTEPAAPRKRRATTTPGRAGIIVGKRGPAAVELNLAGTVRQWNDLLAPHDRGACRGGAGGTARRRRAATPLRRTTGCSATPVSYSAVLPGLRHPRGRGRRHDSQRARHHARDHFVALPSRRAPRARRNQSAFPRHCRPCSALTPGKWPEAPRPAASPARSGPGRIGHPAASPDVVNEEVDHARERVSRAGPVCPPALRRRWGALTDLL